MSEKMRALPRIPLEHFIAASPATLLPLEAFVPLPLQRTVRAVVTRRALAGTLVCGGLANTFPDLLTTSTG